MTQSAHIFHGRATSHSLWLAAALVTPILATTTALADVACGDKTCSTGFVCETYEAAACKPTDATDEKSADCTSTVGHACTAAPCTVDADCGDGMACYTSTTSQCSGATRAACDPAAPDCAVDDEPEQPSCTTTTEQKCAYRYAVPCTVASDCGPGFTCEETQSCGCSGSSGAVRGTVEDIDSDGTDVAGDTVTDSRSVNSGSGVASSGGATGVSATDIVAPSEPICSCEPTGTFACKLQTIACSVDADCPSGLACAANSNGTCTQSPDGTSSCTTPDPVKLCQLPYQRVARDSAKSESNYGEDSTIPAADPLGDADGTHSQSGSGTSASNNDNDQAVGEAIDNQASISGGGCTMTRSTRLLDSGLFSLMLAFGLAFRRRCRRGSI